ncbi:eukaryotic translation initiation factor 2 subunit 2 [Pyrgilauda ruficollis]|uniref:eukaryotic translation initiation factor 2 subunit 2 n=1 Tax=Pyrgilauda ruficollis TaxID=221976 RepID=UPI001B8614D1|nr:eukaryotic translation initiation factor 2 subunit 2 [Pyrgilauda ruficollis]
MIFDPTMSKKKKKKKKPFMLDEEGGGDTQTEETQQSETKEVEPEPTEDKDVEADEEDSRKKDTTDDLDDLNFFNQKKKKKKTKKIFDIDEAEEGVKELKIEGDVPETVEPEDDLDIMLGNKKKKKKNVKFPDEDEIMEKDEGTSITLLSEMLKVKRSPPCIAEEYVTCHTCRSPDTILQKDTRLYFLQCETCHSRCSVASIKTGFQAVTGKRAQLRAKAN